MKSKATLEQFSKYAVIGLGQTGLSCVNYLLRHNIVPMVCDTRAAPPLLAQLDARVSVHCGELSLDALQGMDVLVVSPGISLKHPVLQALKQQGVRLVGDIELFAWQVKAPVIGITGSNGKSTVTTLVGEMAKAAGLKVAVAGNIGLPVLDALHDDIDLYVLELSSFQLETTESLALCAATLLNLSEDHMDRYDDMADYLSAKQRIFAHADCAVVNLDDEASTPRCNVTQSIRFSVRQRADYYLKNKQLVASSDALCDIASLHVMGAHNYANVLSALALAQAAGIERASALRAAQAYTGLAHRCQRVSSQGGRAWLNDSKATNVGATLAALEGLADESGELWLIVGGDSKQADLSALKAPFSKLAGVVAFGRDKSRFVGLHPHLHLVDDLAQAVQWCAERAKLGDIVLLSPACASLDMYRNFEQRGEHFCQLVNAL